jgi:hypothetical protein
VTTLVDQVFPNGDLHVSGTQTLNLNGEKTDIRIQGRVRVADISADNSVLSSRLAEAKIDYTGSGFVTRSADSQRRHTAGTQQRAQSAWSQCGRRSAREPQRRRRHCNRDSAAFGKSG